MSRNLNLSLSQDTTELHRRKRELLLDNWGLISAMARRLKVSPTFVSAVFWNRRRSARVERALRRRGLWLPTHNASMPVRRRRRNV